MHSLVDTSSRRAPTRVASVTVTYNGAAVLRPHLESLRAQTCQLDEIVVVDNASSDETRQLMADEFPEVTLIALPNNVGVGGGLAAGLEYAALKKRYEWVWTFDQDSIPAPDALERLLSAFEQASGENEVLAIIAPMCRNSETGMSYPPLSWQGSGFAPSEWAPSDNTHLVDMVISSGSLIRSSAIAEVGLPRQDFFIDFVDYEYCLRLRRYGFRIGVVSEATLEHSIGSPASFSLLGQEKSWADHAPWREYYMARNEIFTIWQYCPNFATKLFVFRRLAQHALGIMLCGQNKFECMRMITRGVFDGLAGRLGIRYLPRQPEVTKPRPQAIRPEPFARKAQ